MPAGRCRTMEQRGAAAPPAAGFSGPTPGSHRGCSFLSSAIGLIPAMEGLLRRVRYLAVSAPGIESIVDDKARQMRQCYIGSGDSGTIGSGTGQQFTGGLHLDPLGQRGLVPLHQHPSPRIDLLVDVDLDRTDIAAT